MLVRGDSFADGAGSATEFCRSGGEEAAAGERALFDVAQNRVALRGVPTLRPRPEMLGRGRSRCACLCGVAASVVEHSGRALSAAPARQRRSRSGRDHWEARHGRHSMTR